MTKTDLSRIYFGETLGEWVSQTHATIIKQFELRGFKIEPNDYGYDSYAMIIDSILSQLSTEELLDRASSKARLDKYLIPMHSAWCANYLDWKSTHYGAVSKGYKTNVNTPDRNDRATTDAAHLCSDDLETYEHLLSVVFELVTKKLLTAGMQKLTI